MLKVRGVRRNPSTFSPMLRAFGEKESVFSQPPSAPSQLLGRSHARALRAHSKFSFFCLHHVHFRSQSADNKDLTGEGFTLQTCIKNLHNHLVHSALWVKASGCTFRCVAFTLCAVVERDTLLRRFCRDAAPVGCVEVKATAFTHKSLSNRKIDHFAK